MLAWLRALGVALLASLVVAGPAQAKWLRAETDRFIIYSESGEGLLRDYAEKLEEFDAVLRMYHGVPIDEPVARKLEIYVLTTRLDLQRAWPGVGSAVAGYYSADEGDIYAVAVRQYGDDLKDDVLFHEYVHHFMHQNRPFGYPGWLSEGWAEYFGPTQIKDKTIEVGGFSTGRASTLGGHWVPYKDILTRSGRAREEWYMFYAQSWLLTHYLMSSPERRPQINRYLQLMASGVDPASAMEQAIGMNLETLATTLKAYTFKGLPYTSHPRPDRPDRKITITTLPKSADDLLLERLRLSDLVDEELDQNDDDDETSDKELEKDRQEYRERRAEALRTIRRGASKYPGDRLADLTLARAEIILGDRAAGETIAQRYVGLDPADAPFLRILAASKFAAGKKDQANQQKLFAEARSLWARSLQADPDHYQSLYGIVQTRMSEPGYPSAPTLDVLLLAHEIAPQVDTISLEAAQGLMAHRRFAEARPLLNVLANDPHGGGIAKAAKALLAQIEPSTPAAN